MVAFERYFRAAGARSAVVGYDDEDRLLKPRVLFRIFQEATYGISVYFTPPLRERAVGGMSILPSG